MDSVKLSQKSFEELDRLRLSIESNPNNRQEGFYIFTKSARKKLETIAWAITYKLARQVSSE